MCSISDNIDHILMKHQHLFCCGQTFPFDLTSGNYNYNSDEDDNSKTCQSKTMLLNKCILNVFERMFLSDCCLAAIIRPSILMIIVGAGHSGGFRG